MMDLFLAGHRAKVSFSFYGRQKEKLERTTMNRASVMPFNSKDQTSNYSVEAGLDG
jgi:hypothetical protein